MVAMYCLRSTSGNDLVLVEYVAQCSVPLSKMSKKYLSRYGDQPRMQASAQSIFKSVPRGDGAVSVSTSSSATDAGGEVAITEIISFEYCRLWARVGLRQMSPPLLKEGGVDCKLE